MVLTLQCQTGFDIRFIMDVDFTVHYFATNLWLLSQGASSLSELTVNISL